MDIYFVNGRPLRGTKHEGSLPKNHLYRNLGAWRFADVTGQAGVGEAGYGLGVTVGDYDNDGHPDIYVNNYGPNVLYRNNGDGTLADVTAQAGVARGHTVGAGANFLDIDGDGRLDLFVSNYVAFTYENHPAVKVLGVPRYPGPRDYPHQPNNLFRSRGNGTFADVSRQSGIAAHSGPGMGTIALDYDNDGDTDIFVCNDTTGNFLFRNEGSGRFQEVALAVGVAYDLYGDAKSSMGADCGDYDHDGRLDLFHTDYQGEMAILFRNLGNGSFEDVTQQSGVHAGSFLHVKWGCALVDFDNDGHPDIFFACGHTEDNIELTDKRTSCLARPVLLHNTGHGTFVNVSDSSGDGMQVKAVGRGVACDDLNNDGRVDVVIVSSRRAAIVLANQSPTQNHWLQLQLHGVKTNRDGVGARVRVVAGDLVQIQEVHSGRGYQSHCGSRLHFGLGQRDQADRIEVHWIGGGADVFERVAADQRLTLTEGTAPAR